MIYEVWVEGEHPIEMTLPALRSAWETTVPDLLAKVSAVEMGVSVIVSEMPEIIVKRII